MTRGELSRNAIEYKLMEPIAFCPTLSMPGKTLFYGRGENLIVPKEGDIITKEGISYSVDFVCHFASYDRDGKIKDSSVTVGLVPTAKPEIKGIERLVLNPTI